MKCRDISCAKVKDASYKTDASEFFKVLSAKKHG